MFVKYYDRLHCGFKVYSKSSAVSLHQLFLSQRLDAGENLHPVYTDHYAQLV